MGQPQRPRRQAHYRRVKLVKPHPGTDAGLDPSLSTTELARERTSLAQHRTHLANERTHLAYLRTSVSLVGFGITLNRFAIYLINNSKITGADASLPALRDVKHIGLAMVVLGILVAVWSLFRYARASRDIDQNLRHRSWRAVIVMTLLFIIPGAGVAVWLFIK
jgi:putative membrane protein